MMLQHLDERAAADRIMRGLGAVLAEGRTRTRDVGGSATTTEFGDAVARAIEAA
jgi:isocitrate/isopropylmalate dehydrogenase